jgi:phenylalanine-4-hydroxylase
MAVAPVVYGASERPPRGDYTRAEADYTCAQVATYSEAEHARFQRLCERQLALLPGRACTSFREALKQMGPLNRIPRFEDINVRLRKATGWEIVAVPGLIPELPFFTLLANKKFPVTDWLREEHEFDYIVEPDVFHDLFGHVPQLFGQSYANYMEAYGKGALRAHSLQAVEALSRLYWYTVEFGLMREHDGLRAYGAGILSSPGELQYSVESSVPYRIDLDIGRCMRTLYKIDTYQQTYFTIESFEKLLTSTSVDFAPMYAAVKAQPSFPANSRLAGDRLSL